MQSSIIQPSRERQRQVIDWLAHSPSLSLSSLLTFSLPFLSSSGERAWELKMCSMVISTQPAVHLGWILWRAPPWLSPEVLPLSNFLFLTPWQFETEAFALGNNGTSYTVCCKCNQCFHNLVLKCELYIIWLVHGSLHLHLVLIGLGQRLQLLNANGYLMRRVCYYFVFVFFNMVSRIMEFHWYWYWRLNFWCCDIPYPDNISRHRYILLPGVNGVERNWLCWVLGQICIINEKWRKKASSLHCNFILAIKSALFLYVSHRWMNVIHS